jgi:hypothetical protein
MSVGSVHSIPQHLVSRMQTPEHKEIRMNFAGEIITMADQDVYFLNDIITRDETRCVL